MEVQKDSNQERAGENPHRLVPQVLTWMKYGNISITAAAEGMAFQFETMSADVFVEAERHYRGAARTRRSLPGGPDKPLDAVGRFCRATLTLQADGRHSCDWHGIGYGDGSSNPQS